MSEGPTFMVVAGEVSGDMLAAGLVRAIGRRAPAARFFGIGGDELRAAGTEILQDASEMAVMGFLEVAVRLRFFRRVFARMVAEAQARRPDAVILVDYPGFNLRLAARLHAAGIPVVYYVCPQVWAWHRSRMQAMARSIDLLLSIFPFEPPLFEGSGINVSFVGHPLVDRIAAGTPATDALPWAGTPRIALLPGSRRTELDRILPAMAAAACLVEDRLPGASFILASPGPAMAEVAGRILAAQPRRPRRLAVVAGGARAALATASAAMVASGTVTVEACLLRCPMIIAYRTGRLTYALARALVRVPHIGMVNLIAGRRICPELIQGEASPRALAEAIVPLAGLTPERARMVDDLGAAAARLGPPGAADRAAERVLDLLARRARVTPTSTPRSPGRDT